MQIIIDPMDDASRWKPLAPDGVTPSTEVRVAKDTNKFRYGEDRASVHITATANARNHTLRRSLPATDLSDFDELRLWVWSTRVADDSSLRPFFLRLRLGSAAMGLADPANSWFRYLPVLRAEVWELVRVTIVDLALQVRSALNVVELACVDDASLECNLDTLLATREQMLGDVEAEMVLRLHRKISVGDTPVVARVHNPDDATPVPMPSIQIIPRVVLLSAERIPPGEIRTDFTDNAFRLRPASIPYNLYYDIDVFAQNRQHKAEIYEFVLRTFAPRSELVVNGGPLTIELVNTLTEPVGTQTLSDRTLLRFKIAAWQTGGTPIPAVRPHRDVSVEVASKATV
jgi:hypothetical protein